MFRASEMKFQTFILTSLELVYGYKACDLFLTEPQAFKIQGNLPEPVAGNREIPISSILFKFQFSIHFLQFIIVINCILETS